MLDVSEALRVEQQVSAHFKRRIKKMLPGIDKLNLDDNQWKQLERCHIVAGKKTITYFSLLNHIATVLGSNYDSVNNSLKKHSPRQHKSRKPMFTLHCHRRKYRHADMTNRLILSLDESDPSLLSPLQECNVRVVSHLIPVTPDKENHSGAQIFTTPTTFSTRVQSVYSNNKVTFYRPTTPQGAKYIQAPGKLTALEQDFPHLQVKQAEPVQFTCTLKKMLEQSGLPRRHNQKWLTGISSKTLFTYCAENKQDIFIEGNQYHWCHMIAHFLGGGDTRRNLIPGTAASNYETLQRIEYFIADMLTTRVTNEIHVVVTPLYDKGAPIAKELIYTLTWQELNAAQQLEDKREVIRINPGSYQRSTFLEDKALECVRSANKTAPARTPAVLVDDDEDDFESTNRFWF